MYHSCVYKTPNYKQSFQDGFRSYHRSIKKATHHVIYVANPVTLDVGECIGKTLGQLEIVAKYTI